jgi:hypothetical protein
VAAQLGTDPDLHVVRRKGGLGELRVVVDGRDVVDTNRLWYQTPRSVVDEVRRYLASQAPRA